MECQSPMTHEQFSAELNYQTAMAIARSMLKRGMISEDQYSLIDTTFAQEYRPIFSALIKE